MRRGVSSGGGQSSLGYLFGSGETPSPKPANNNAEVHSSSLGGQDAKNGPAQKSPAAASSVDAVKHNPAGVPAIPASTTNNYFRADGQNCGNFLTDRPTTKVHAAPGGGSSLDFLFSGSGGGK